MTRCGGTQGAFKKVPKVISVPIAAQIVILPIMIKNFNTISITFLISNLIAMPLLGTSIIGGFILVFLSFIWLWGAKQLGIIFNSFLKTLMFIAKHCGKLKLSNIYVITPNVVTIIIYYSIVFLVIYYFKYREKIATFWGRSLLLKIWKKQLIYPNKMRWTYKDKL